MLVSLADATEFDRELGGVSRLHLRQCTFESLEFLRGADDLENSYWSAFALPLSNRSVP